METKTEKVEKTQGVETTKKVAEKKVSMSLTMIKKMAEEPELTKAFLAALEADKEAIAPILFAQAEGAVRQLKLKV